MNSQPEGARPYIQWNHIDGPLLVCSDGHLHWLTMHERMMLRFGFTNTKLLDKKHSRLGDSKA